MGEITSLFKKGNSLEAKAKNYSDLNCTSLLKEDKSPTMSN